MDGIAVAGEVVTAGTALAGLILIYIGSLVTSFGNYDAAAQKSVKFKFAGRAWLAFVGFLLALVAAAFAILGKWLSNACLASNSVWLLLIAFCWATFATVQAIREMH